MAGMNIALFGGTFNPVHWGHLMMAEAAREAASLDRVIFLPTGAPPHKRAPRTTARHRLAMLRLALRDNPAFQVSDWEIRQPRTVYTTEALAHFQRKFPKDRLHFILGSDSLRDVPLWRDGERLLGRAQFLAIERPEAPWNRLPSGLRRKARRIPAIPVPLASREIRERVRAGRSIRYQVPDAVERYIRQRRLYRNAEAS
jgi:nicotinate-nucleotide adenylyltransferase